MNRTIIHDSSTHAILGEHKLSVSPEHYDFHFHDRYEIYFFLNGSGEMLVNQTRYPLSPGSLLIFNPNEVHRVVPEWDAPYERMNIHFWPELVRALPMTDCNLLACFQNHIPGLGNAAYLSGTRYQSYYELFARLIGFSSSASYGSQTMTFSCLLQLLVLTNEAFTAAQPKALSFTGFVSQAIGYIEGHLSEPLSLSDLSAVLNVDAYYLSHQFKEQTGTSPYHYVLVKRIAYAKQLLIHGTSCMNTCEQAGFGEYNNFVRTFKKYVGLTPGAYQKKYGEHHIN